MKSYKLSYLPSFYEDLNNAVNYISDVLENPQAANNLIDKTEAAILKRLQMPLSYEPVSINGRKHPYYRIYVENYIVFYVIIDDVMEVRRLIYGARDIGRLI